VDISVGLCGFHGSTFERTDLANVLFERHAVDGGERQVDEGGDAVLEEACCLREGPLNFDFAADDGGGVFDASVQSSGGRSKRGRLRRRRCRRR
jgi:hypothetical protein